MENTTHGWEHFVWRCHRFAEMRTRRQQQRRQNVGERWSERPRPKNGQKSRRRIRSSLNSSPIVTISTELYTCRLYYEELLKCVNYSTVSTVVRP